MDEQNGVYFADVYAKLAEPFEHTFKDVRGGVSLEYITGEQCITRLNETLGVAGWGFAVKEHGINAEADEAWALGEIQANIGGTVVHREQFGSQKIKRSKASGVPMDIGFDLKGAATDALKKCAMLLGVGLYLSKKDEQPTQGNGSAHSGTAAAAGNGSRDSAGPGTRTLAGEDLRQATELACVECGTVLDDIRFRDGTVWTPADLAGHGSRKHGRVLCMQHYRAANDAKRAAERGAAPF